MRPIRFFPNEALCLELSLTAKYNVTGRTVVRKATRSARNGLEKNSAHDSEPINFIATVVTVANRIRYTEINK